MTSRQRSRFQSWFSLPEIGDRRVTFDGDRPASSNTAVITTKSLCVALPARDLDKLGVDRAIVFGQQRSDHIATRSCATLFTPTA
jgi:hypothetical protein